MSEEIEEVISKPESMLSAKTKQVLIEAINEETEKALKEGDDAGAMELQNAKKLVERGCWSVRESNPYLEYMGECLLGQGGTLKDTQEAMKKCAEEWDKLPAEKKAEYKVRAGKLGIYDFL